MSSFFNKLSKSASPQVKASTAYTICSVLQRCLSFITLPIFSRMLTTEEYGLSTVYSSTMALLIIFTSLQLPYGSFATAMTEFEDDRNNYITSINYVCTGLTIIFYIIYIPFHAFWNKYLDIPTLLIVVMGIEMLMTTSLNLWMGKQRFEYKYKGVVLVILSSSILGTIIAIITTYFSNDKGITKVLAYSIVAISVGIVPYVKSMIHLRDGLKLRYIKYALSFNLPLIPYYLSQMIFNQSDRLMINSMCGRSDAAMYGVTYNLAIILTFVINAVNNSYVPWFYGKLKENKFEANKKVSFAISALMAVLLLGVISLAPEIIYVLAGKKYESAVWVVPPVAMSLIFLLYTQFSINVEFFFEEKKAIVFGSILSAVVNIVLNYFFIKEFGFVAAAYTTLLSYILFALCNYISMVKICRKRYIDANIYNTKKLLILAFVFCFIGFGFMALYNMSVVRYCVIAAVLLIGLINIKKIMVVVKEYVSVFR